MRHDLRKYLQARCDHHWHHSAADDVYDEHWQCLWCNDVLWHPDVPLAPWQVCNPDASLDYWPTALVGPREHHLRRNDDQLGRSGGPGDDV